MNEEIVLGLTQHKKNLRSRLINVKTDLATDLDDFFIDLMGVIRSDWNLFTVQETLISEVKKFSEKVTQNLGRITGKGNENQDQDISMLYEQLSMAQTDVKKENE